MGVIIDKRKLHVRDLPSSYTVVDTETTGFDHNRNELLEIAAIRVRDGKPVKDFQTLVRASKVEKEAQEVNHITKSMIAKAPKADEAVAMLVEFIGDDILVAHNATFDKSFIESVRRLDNNWIDSLDIAKIVFPQGRGGRSLANLCQRLGVANKDEHRALGDCYATAECYRRMVAMMAETSEDWRDIMPSVSKPYKAPQIAGKGFTFTGECGTSRHDLMQMVVDCGGIVQNGITKKTDYLVNASAYGDEWKTGKTEAAGKSDTVQTISLKQFRAMLPPEPAKSIDLKTKPSGGSSANVYRAMVTADKESEIASKSTPSKKRAKRSIWATIRKAFFIVLAVLCALLSIAYAVPTSSSFNPFASLIYGALAIALFVYMRKKR